MYVVPSLKGVVCVCLLLCKKEGSSPESAITERKDVGLYEVPLYMCFFAFWDGDYVSQLPCVWYYVGVRCSFQHAREKYESRKANVSCYFYFVLLPLGPELW